MTRSRSVAVVDVDAVRSRFEQWRQTRQGNARIPDELWAAAIELARRNGINQTAAPLRLDGGKRKRLMLAAGASSHRTAPPTFAELKAPGGLPAESTVAEYTLELEGHNRKLRTPLQGRKRRGARCSEPGTVGHRILIQITPRLHILVAFEPVDGRKYASSMNMRSLSNPDC